jgi:hypothetical protein
MQSLRVYSGRRKKRAGDAMARAIRNTSELSSGDRAAIANCVTSLPPVEGPPGPKKTASRAQ